MKYILPQLGYGYNALEPYIDEKTMEIHHSKHHQAYINNLNTILEKYPALDAESVENLLLNRTKLKVDEKDRKFFVNNAGGTLNHSFFWKILGPKKEIDEKLTDSIKREFGSMEDFKEIFADIALKHFGSGWAWLSQNPRGDLEVYSLPNQDSPLSLGHTPLLALDLWEHAYYLKYQNRRAEYINVWWNVVKII